MASGRTHQHGTAPQLWRSRTLALASLGMAIVAVAAYVNLDSAPSVLLQDLLLVALGGIMAMHLGPVWVLGWTPWIAAGALWGGALMSVLDIAPWPLAAGLAFAAAGFLGARSLRPRFVGRIGVVALSAAGNALLLWALLFSQHRPIAPTEFTSRELRLHELLADVPLHDVWVAHLRGGPRGITMQDVRWQLVDGFKHNLYTAFIVVAGMREVLGSLLRWDDDQCHHPEASFVHRLTETDRARSLIEPGDSLFVYAFDHEALMEITNCTVHAFIGIALEPVEDGYDLYWAFYVKPVGSITRFYMALIEPFRHTVIYPPIIEGIEREWAKRSSSAQNDCQTTLNLSVR